MALKFNYGKSRRTAHKLISKFGAVGQLLRHPTFAPEDIIVAAVTYENRQIDGTRIRQSDRYLLIDTIKPDGTTLAEPKENRDRVVFDGRTYELITCNPLSPAGVVVMYEGQGRA